MKILKNVYDKIITAYPPAPPEHGGILGIKDGIICDYMHDSSNTQSVYAVYIPDTELFNRKIEKWMSEGTEFAGIVHSHIKDCRTLSSGDKEYITALFNSIPERIELLYFPVVTPHTGQMYSYAAVRTKDGITIMPDQIDIVGL